MRQAHLPKRVARKHQLFDVKQASVEARVVSRGTRCSLSLRARARSRVVRAYVSRAPQEREQRARVWRDRRVDGLRLARRGGVWCVPGELYGDQCVVSASREKSEKTESGR